MKKPKLQFKGSHKVLGPSEIIHLGDEDGENALVIRKYERRGHMPPTLRRASYYDMMKDTFHRL